MGAIGMLARSEIRRRWRGVVVITLVVGFVGAVVLATVAGARRSDSALGRFNAYSRSSDVELQVGDTTTAQLRAFRAVAGVRDVAVLRGFFLQVRGAPNLAIAAAVDAKLGTAVDRPRLIAGRRADLATANEVTIGEGLAAQLHKGLGDHLDVESYTPAQGTAAVRDGSDPGAPEGPRLKLQIVGIVRRPLDLGDRGASGGVLVLTPAFIRDYSGRIFTFQTVLRIRTVGGTHDVPRVVRAARRIFPPGQFGFSVQPLAIESEGARNAIDVLTVALWIFAGVAAVAGVVAIGIVLTREISLMTVDQSTFRALGLTRGQRVAMSGPGALLIAVGGTLVAALGAAFASPLFPIGVARRADPDPGLHVDWVVLILGAIAIAAFVLAIAMLAALRSAQRLSVDRAPQRSGRGSMIVELAGRGGLPPTATNGLRMALEPGRGATAVPIRSAFLGAVAGVLGVIAAFMFASSLDRLAATPRLYGWTWDLEVHDGNAQSCGQADLGLQKVAGVGAVASVCYQNIELDGRPVTAYTFTPIRGAIDPEVVAGRAPGGPREVALGSVTLDALGKSIGDTVQARGPHTNVDYRIVGRIVLPRLGDPQPLADGAAFTGAGFSPILDAFNVSRYLLVRVAPGADHVAVEHRISAAIASVPGAERPTGSTLPAEIDRLREADGFPPAVAALLVVLALLALGHTLVTAGRRRRRELALLKTLGFDRRQVRATVAWQATTPATVGLVVGIPAGLIVGRFIWSLVATGLGVSTTATVPTLALLVTIPGAVVLVNLIAFLPGRVAARTRPAVALRSE